MASTGIAPCPSCDQLTITAALPGGFKVTLDRHPDSQGLVAAQQTALGAWLARRETPGVALDVTEKRYAIHTCSAESAAEPPAGVARLDEWRRAEAARKGRQRRGKGRRRATPIRGARWTPDGLRVALAITLSGLSVAGMAALTAADWDTLSPPPARHARVTVWRARPWFKQIVSSRERP